ncbi:MAG TPA: ABC transporter ATP-binding protein [Thermodesulfobacteriota bacterium]
MTKALVLEGVDAWYGAAQVLFGLSLRVAPGEVVALLGRNGAGKTTTLRAIMGLVPRRRGRIEYGGVDLTGLPTHRIARLGIGYVPEDRRILATLTVRENLEVGRQPPRPGAPVWSVSRLFDLFPSLASMADRSAGGMSGGEQQMLAIARTLMGNPSLLLLDEPSEGLAPLVVEELARTLSKLAGEGLSVLLAEQNVHFARRLAGRAAIVEKGRVQVEGTMEAIVADEGLRRRYLAV